MNHDNPEFESWWSINHPFDWWAKERGQPFPQIDRLRVWSLCKDAFEAGSFPPSAKEKK